MPTTSWHSAKASRKRDLSQSECGDRIPLGGRPIRPTAGASFRTDRPSGGCTGRGWGRPLGTRCQDSNNDDPHCLHVGCRSGADRPCRQPKTARGKRHRRQLCQPCLGTKASRADPRAIAESHCNRRAAKFGKSNSTEEMAELNAAAAALGQQLHLLSASTVAEIDQAFVQLGQQRPDALLLYGDLFFTGQRDLIIALAARHRIPTIYHAEEFTRAGGLISYGASPAAAYRQAGIYTGRILNGEKPADLPVHADQVRAGASTSRPPRRSGSQSPFLLAVAPMR